MALSSYSQLPIIDFSEEAMKPGTKTWDLTREHVRKALEEYGCFEATFSEINPELYALLFSSLEKLFDLPKDTKRRFTSDVLVNGYYSDLPQKPLLEGMRVMDPLNFLSFHDLALLFWPLGDATLCETLHSYSMRVSKLEKTVREMIFESYGVEKHFEKESIKYSIGLHKYKAPNTNEGIDGLGAHFDNGLITILQEDGVGLQVLAKDGEWIDVAPSGSSLVVMIGESFFGWSNGRLRCPLHRVRMSTESKSRYSIGLFSSKEGTVEIPSEVVDEQHPLLFKPFDPADLFKIIMQRVKEATTVHKDNNIVPIVATHFAI